MRLGGRPEWVTESAAAAGEDGAGAEGAVVKYLHALWQALMAFFSHLKEHQREETKTEQAKEETKTIEAQRERHDEVVRGSGQRNVDERLDKWMRD